MPPPVPRVFIIRHGETEWTLSGRHTGVTDIPLTAAGESRIRSIGKALVGQDRLIVPANLAAVFVSPRKRARRTLELLLEEGVGGKSGKELVEEWEGKGLVETRDDIREWDYGEYEGKLKSEINEGREKKGLGGGWNIWRDGCEGGESSEQITNRLDNLIADLRNRIHAPPMNHYHEGKNDKQCPPSDVLVVAHGHILRSLAARWINNTVSENPKLILDVGGVGTLSYEHHNINEPAIILGNAFVVHEN